MTLRTINRKQLTGVTGGFDFSPLLRRKGQSQGDAKQKVQSSLSQVMSSAISGGGADTPKKK